MGEPVITVEGLSKRYTLRHRASGPGLLRDRLAELLRAPFRRRAASTQEEFWALRNLNFSVNRGEVVGIIGRNGAGKSTLLKVLSRITEPTTGRVTIQGRVASLLEVGTGFHGELTGRENIFLNGAILGMTRREIRQKFDEIVAFAEVEKFLDTPVKFYSSGMYVRLAFAVAAHLEPEILIVDEVLAVGDAAFQQRCLGKIRNVVSNEGRTVLIVSHNLSIILSLCDRALLLRAGQVEIDGKPDQAVAAHLAAGGAQQFTRASEPKSRAAIIGAWLENVSGAGRPYVRVHAQLRATVPIKPALEVKLHDRLGEPVAFGSLGGFDPTLAVELTPGTHTVVCQFPSDALANGHYSISLKLSLPFIEALDEAPQCLAFDHELAPRGSATHVLQQSWGSGAFILDLQRLA